MPTVFLLCVIVTVHQQAKNYNLLWKTKCEAIFGFEFAFAPVRVVHFDQYHHQEAIVCDAHCVVVVLNRL